MGKEVGVNEKHQYESLKIVVLYAYRHGIDVETQASPDMRINVPVRYGVLVKDNSRDIVRYRYMYNTVPYRIS